jgi:GDP-4-dehydro-6-deoxy-D-mannose reductase
MARVQAMRVLITGATGFAGRHLVSLCSSEGCAVTGLGRQPASLTELPAELDDYEACDLLDPEQAAAVVQAAAPERIFHLAAQASVARSWEDPVSAIHANLFSTLQLLEVVRRDAPEARVLVACSGEEYGRPEFLPVTEEHPIRPQNPYALSKASVDMAAGLYSDAYGLRVVRTRAFNHAGPGQAPDYVVAHFARQVARAEAEGREGELVVTTGNVDVKRDFTDVRDVVRAYWLALEESEPGAYNVCSGRPTAVSEILELLAAQTSLVLRQRTDPALLRERDVMEISGSHEKLKRATGWEPKLPLEQTVGDTLDWWRAKLAAEVTT